MPYTAFDQLREANPVPDPKARHAREADLAALADSVLRDAHNQDVDSVVLKPHVRRPRAGAWWLPPPSVAAAFVLGLILISVRPIRSPEVANTVLTPDRALGALGSHELHHRGLRLWLQRHTRQRSLTGSALEFFNSSETEFHNLVVLKLNEDWKNSRRLRIGGRADDLRARSSTDLDCYRAEAFGVTDSACDSDADNAFG